MPAYLVPNLRPFSPSAALCFPTPAGPAHPHLLHASDATLYRGPHRLRSVHTHDVNHLVLVTSGTGLFHIDGHDHPAAPGRVFLVDPNVPHTFLGRPSDTTRYSELTFRTLAPDARPRPTPISHLLAAWSSPLAPSASTTPDAASPSAQRRPLPELQTPHSSPSAPRLSSPAPRSSSLAPRVLSAAPRPSPWAPRVAQRLASPSTVEPPSLEPDSSPAYLQLTPAQTDRLHRIILDVIPLCSQTTPAAELHTVSLLHSAFLLLLEASAPPPPVEPDLLDVADAYLRDHATRPLSLSDLSRHVGLTPNYLCRAFAARFGEPPLRRHHRHRLAAALRLLESTDLPMRRVAQLTGFRDEFYFSRVVRAATGKPPATYRKHAWAKA